MFKLAEWRKKERVNLSLSSYIECYRNGTINKNKKLENGMINIQEVPLQLEIAK